MTTLAEVLNNLRNEGYTTDFNLNDNCLVCHGNTLELHPEDFVVDRHYRFEGESDPGDEAIVYAISSDKYNLKGVLVNGYGIYSNPASDKLMAALSEKARNAPHSFDNGVPAASALPAPMNLNDIAQSLLTDDSWIDRKVFPAVNADGLKTTVIALRKGAVLKEHTAPGPITVHVIKGRIAFRTGAEEVQLSDGGIIALTARVPHSVEAFEDSAFLLTMHRQ